MRTSSLHLIAFAFAMGLVTWTATAADNALPEEPKGVDAALLTSAKSGDLAGVKAALKSGAFVDVVDGGHRTAIYNAAAGGFTEIINELVAHHADVNIASYMGSGTPIGVAVASGHGDAAKALLKAGADPAKAGPSKSTALHAAALVGDIPFMKLFMEKGAHWDTIANCSGTPLHVAARAGQVEAINFLLDHGAKVDVRGELGSTPLMEAARWDQKSAVEALLGRGADPALTDESGKTALEIALKWHCEHALQALSRH